MQAHKNKFAKNPKLLIKAIVKGKIIKKKKDKVGKTALTLRFDIEMDNEKEKAVQDSEKIIFT